MGLTTLYRFFDAPGHLLYIGISARGAARWSEHAAEKPWWPEVAVTTVEHFLTREDAAAAEADAIRREQPRYNRAGRSQPGQPVDFAALNREARAKAAARGVTPIGVKGIAEWLGVHPNTVSRTWIGERQRVKDPVRRFPEPTWPGSRPAWALAVVEKWAIATGRLHGPPAPENLYRVA